MLGDCATPPTVGYSCISKNTQSFEKGSALTTRQITVGFDVEVSPNTVARILAAHYGDVTVGQGVQENGLPQGFIYVANKKRKKKHD
jgi:hypothetical protein